MNFEPKPDIENFVSNLFCKKTKYVPLAELGVHPKIKELIINRPILNLKDDIDFWYKAGYDYIKLQPICDFNPQKIGIDNKPKSDLNHYNWASETSGIINSFEDLAEFEFPKKSQFDYSKFENVKPLLPEGMGVVGQYGDIFTMTWEMMGFENFSIALYEDLSLVMSLNNILGKLVVSMFDYFGESDAVDVLWYSDDIAYQQGLMVSPDVLDILFFPWIKQIGKIAKRHNKPFIYHSDGILYEVFDKLIGFGVSAIHPVEPKAMNIVDVKKKYSNSLCVIGNIDVDLLSRGSKDEVRINIISNIEKLSEYPGFCIGSGNSIPDYTKLENYIELLNTVKDYNKSLD